MTQAEQLAAQAAQWQAAGRADMAAQLYGAALEQDPSKFAIRMQLAECLVALGQAEAAAEQYLMVAQAYAARGRHQECLAICERVLAIAPQAFVYMSVGPMVRRIGRAARPLCARAAETHLAAGRQTDGLQILRLGAELDPHNPDVRRQLARIYQARHMKREAVEALLDAGNLLLQAKRHEDYVQVAEQILALEPKELDTLRDLPRVYLELRRPHDAVRMLGQLTKASPGDIAGYEILAQAFAVIGRIDKSLSVLERLVEQLGATGQADKADAILNHARFWRPTDVGFLRSLKRIVVPRPPAPAERPAARPAAPEGTVVLSIADLLVDEGSKRAPAPGQDRGGVKLTEAEGTLTLRLDDLILDEMEQAAGRGVAPTKPPPGGPPSGGPPPPPSRRRLPPPPSRPGAGAGGRAAPPAGKASDEGPRRSLSAPPLPAPRLGSPRAEPSVDATVALEAGDLIESLTGEVLRSQLDLPAQPDGTDETELLSTDHRGPSRAPEGVAPTIALHVPNAADFADDERTTTPPPPRPAAPGRSMSELIYDDEDADVDADARREESRKSHASRVAALADEEDSEVETLLHMRPLTAEDIARALAKQAAQAAASAPPPSPPSPAPTPAASAPDVPLPRLQDASPPPAAAAPLALDPDDFEVDEPTMAPSKFPPLPMPGSRRDLDLDEPTMAPSKFPPLPMPGSRRDLDLDAPTVPPPRLAPPPLATASPREIDLDAPTVPPPPARPTGSGDEAPTIANLSPLAAADIARALSQRSPTRPPAPPVNDDAATLPPPSSRPLASVEPEAAEPDEPPLLPPLLSPGAGVVPNAHEDDEEEEELTITMDALRPEDLLRGPSGGRRS